MILQIKNGTRKPPKIKWTKDKIKKMVAKTKNVFLEKHPIGTKRKHQSRQDLFYWVIKTRHGKRRWKYEHRVLMEEKIGRKLKRSEHIHHVNHNTLDNRIENLKIINASNHSRHHSIIIHKKNPLLRFTAAKVKSGMWSRKFKECIQCYKKNYIHASHGICSKCYQINWRKSHTHITPLA